MSGHVRAFKASADSAASHRKRISREDCEVCEERVFAFASFARPIELKICAICEICGRFLINQNQHRRRLRLLYHTCMLQCRRLSRLTNAFSKKLENFKAAVALHYAYYNFV